MNKHKLHNVNHLTAKQMQDYLSGTLSNTEMHTIEKHLLECDFCTEAMEGLESMDEYSGFEEDVSALKTRVERRAKKPKRETVIIPLYKKVLRIAAMLAVLIVASVLVTNYFKSDVTQKEFSEKKKTEIQNEKTTETKQDEKKQAAASDSTLKPIEKPVAKQKPDKSEPRLIVESKKAVETKTNSRDNEKDISPPIADATNEITMDEVDVSEEDVAGMEMVDDMEEMVLEEEAYTAEAAPVSVQSRVKNNSIAMAPAVRPIYGIVLSEDSTPLPYVSIVLDGSENRVVSDGHGEFEIMAPEGKQKLIVSYVGYESKEIELSNYDTLAIVLMEDNAMLDALVVSENHAKRQKSTTFAETGQPHPAIGEKDYQNYLEKNLIYPEAARNANIKGTVTLGFTVKKNGKITKVKVIKSLGYGCDKEAIRLLKEGSAWNPGNKDGKPIEMEAELKVEFK